MGHEENENSEVYNYYLELSKPTKEDFERVFTEEELKELCLKHKCTVDMWRWNVVNDYRIVFTESGRFQRWSEKERLGMLAKAVNKKKPSILYDEEEIRKARKEDWELQLKENILSLNFWKRKRLQRFLMAESDNVDQEVHNLIVTQSDIEESSVENSPIYSELDHEVQLEIEVNTESVNVDELLTQSQRAELPAANIPKTNGEEQTIEDDSVDSVATVLLNKHKKQLHSEEVAPEIENIYGINTMSMTIDSQITTQSENLPVLQSQDVIPPNYDNFKKIIPLTSTQSQSQGLEEFILS